MRVNKKTKFSEIVNDAESRRILEERGMHCLGCPFSSMESLEQGAKAHGLDAGKLVKEINRKKKRK